MRAGPDSFQATSPDRRRRFFDCRRVEGTFNPPGFLSLIAIVDSAEEGIAIAIQERPDLVLMDIRLRGEKDGVQAAEGIRRAG